MTIAPEDHLDIYVPGSSRCLKCGFQLQTQTIFMVSGTIGLTREQAMGENLEPCPNDGEPMVKVRWSERAQENYNAYVALMEEVIAIAGAEHLPGALTVLKQAVAKAREALSVASVSTLPDGEIKEQAPNLAPADTKEQG